MTTNQPNQPAARAHRRFVGVTALAIAATAGIVGFTALGGSAATETNDEVEPPTATTSDRAASRPAYLIIDDEIDRSLAEQHRTTVTTVETHASRHGFAPVTPDTTTPRPAYLIIEDEIDRALQERSG